MQKELVDFAAEISREKRLILLGGLAVIGHGLDRGTKDADLWMEPMGSAQEWIDFLLSVVAKFPRAKIVTLPSWQEVFGASLVDNLEEVGMVRIEGLGVPLDLFRTPNGINMNEFDLVWEKSRHLPDQLALPHPIDLVRTKEGTSRPHDQQDHVYLMSVARKVQGDKLSEVASMMEARKLLNEFFDYAVLEKGLENPSVEIQAFLWNEVENLARDGDPFAKEMLERRD